MRLTMSVARRDDAVPEDHQRALGLAAAGCYGACTARACLAAATRMADALLRIESNGLNLEGQSTAAGSRTGKFVVGKCCEAGWRVARTMQRLRYFSALQWSRGLQAQCNLGYMIAERYRV